VFATPAPTHPLLADALGQMDFWFDLSEQEAVKIAGLSHRDPKVRAAAAWVLLWDEPVAAEGPLLRATRDPVPEVAAEATNTLEYYPTLPVISRLHDLLGHADAKVRGEATDSYESIRNELLIRLCGRDRRVAEHIIALDYFLWGKGGLQVVARLTELNPVAGRCCQAIHDEIQKIGFSSPEQLRRVGEVIRQRIVESAKGHAVEARNISVWENLLIHIPE
jgi:hypothetical protein